MPFPHDVDGTWVNTGASYDAGELRRADAALFSQAGIASGLAVSVDGSDVVTVTAGQAVISGEDAVTGTGVYRAGIASSVTGALTARHATLSRIDLVVFRQLDTDVVPAHAARTSRIEIIPGTASSTPVVPTRPSMAVELARITVPAVGGGAASVNSANRVSAQAVGGNQGTAWTSYTPVWAASTTNPVLGNAVVSAAYQQVGKTVDFRIRIAMGSTTAYGTGTYNFSLPVPTLFDTVHAIGAMLCTKAGGGRFARTAFTLSSTQVQGSSDSAALVTPTSPFTWASGDVLSITGTYEAA